MSEAPLRPTTDDDLQFTTAERAAPGGPVPTQHACALCGQPMGSTYYALNEHLICPACRDLALAPPEGLWIKRFFVASVFGLGAGLLGALVWFIIRRVAHFELGLVAIAVGFVVGKAVRYGSGNRGGRGYQLLAVLLTYCCIAANYMPDVIESIMEHRREDAAAEAAAVAEPIAGQPLEAPVAPPAKVAVADNAPAPTPMKIAIIGVFAFVFSLALPFLAGTSNLIGLLIIGFALWEAWKFNAYRPLPISGPFEMGPSPTA
jgi:hypothetical protein